MRKSLSCCILFLLCTLSLRAQESNVKKNIVKVNLTSIALNNYSIQYEGVWAKNISFLAAFKYMPTGTLPLKNTILNNLPEEAPRSDSEEYLNRLEIGSWAFTPEVRFYLSKKGYGRGFYLAPFYRYASFKAANLRVEGDPEEGQEEITIDLNGKITAHTGGLAIGAQWFLGKSFTLDWTIIGPHYGRGKGLFSGETLTSIDAETQVELRRVFEEVEIPSSEVSDLDVHANGASAVIRSPWLGIRAGISLGFRF